MTFLLAILVTVVVLLAPIALCIAALALTDWHGHRLGTRRGEPERYREGQWR